MIEEHLNGTGLQLIATSIDPDAYPGKTILLIGPNKGFWDHFETSEEYLDGNDNPLDRWSKRVLIPIAASIKAQALFPSDGPPYPPFFKWALNSKRIFQSPIQLLVHDKMGLMVSFRGALIVDKQAELSPQTSPCLSCSAPCLTACPATAFSDQGYDHQKCRTYLNTHLNAECIYKGCIARHICPQNDRNHFEDKLLAYSITSFRENADSHKNKD